MADIRSFFGKKVEKKKSEGVGAVTSASVPTGGPSGAAKRTNEPELLDSDDDFVEEVKPERKRLKSVATKESVPSLHVAPSPAPQISMNATKRKATIDLSEEEEPSMSPLNDSQSSPLTTQQSDSQLSDVQTQSPVKVLPTISRKPTKTVTGNRVELKGSVNSFFGDPDPPKPKEVPPPPKKIQKVTHDESDEDSDELSQKGSKKSKSKAKKSIAPPMPIIPEDVEVNSIPPQGRENCLDGYKIAFTGAMGEYMSRADLEALVLQYGGKVAQSISGKTTFLVASPLLEDGRDSSTSTKYRTSIEKEIKIITEKQFLGLIQNSVKNASKAVDLPDQSSINRASSNSSVSRIVKSMVPTLDRSSSSSSTTSQPAAETSQLLWVDKYKPKRLEDVVGAAESVRKILDWLKKWPDVHIRKTIKVPFSKENPGGKSLLLSGPPGIGKTTLATLVAKTLGYEVLEFNASDVRSKNAIIAQVSDVVRSQAMGTDGKLKKRLVIMDEVDGMGGSDRGGIPELIKVIKSSHTPIVCICNDRQERKIRSLANHCFDIRLRRPTKKMIADRLVRIGQLEGLMIEPNAAELLVEQMGNDIRQVINASQMWRAQSTTMKYRDLAGSVGGVMPYVDSEEGDPVNESAGRLRGIQKDKILRQSPFDACGLILGGRKTDFHERYNSFFIDYSLLPLLVEQNYIDSSRNGIFKNPGSDAQKLEQLSRAADTISDMDLAGSALRGQDMHWELLPLQAALSLKVGDHVQGFQGFPTFPQWLGKYSTTNKSKRLTQEIVVHTNLAIRQSFDPIRLEYIPYLRHHLVSVLKGTDRDSGECGSGIEEVIQILDDYGLSRDDMMETLKDMQFVVENDKNLFDRYSTIDTKLKTAFTKKYNSMEHKSQALIEEYQISKRKARSKVGGGDDLEEGEDLETTEDLEAAKEVIEERDSDDDEALQEFMKKHSKKATGSNKRTTSTSSGGGSRRKK